MPSSDLELLRASRAGRPEAFGRLVTRYQSLVCAVAFSATGDLALSEDVAQEAFVTAWSKLGELRDPTRFSAWVCGIARNLARYARRHQRRHAPAATEPMDRLVQVPSPAPSPLEQAITRQQAELVWRALRELPEHYREPIVLFYREQKSLKQVAEALALSEDTVKQRLCRGRGRLERGVADLLESALAATRSRKDLTAAVVALICLPAGEAAASVGVAHGALGTGLFKSIALGGVIAVAAAVATVVVIRPPAPGPVSPAPAELVRLPSSAEPVPAAPDVPDRIAASDSPAAPVARITLGPASVRSAPSPRVIAPPMHRARPAPRRHARAVRPAAPQAIVSERGPTSVQRHAVPAAPSVSLTEIIDLAPLDPPWRDRGALPIEPPDLLARVGDLAR